MRKKVMEENFEYSGQNPLDYMTITPTFEKKATRFKSKIVYYDVQFDNLEKNENGELLFKTVVEEVMKRHPGKRIGMKIDHWGLPGEPFCIPFREHHDYRDIANKIELISQSARSFKLDEGLSVEVAVVQVPRGRALKRKFTTNTERWLKSKRSVLFVPSNGPNDPTCLPRAVLMAKARLDLFENNYKEWKAFLKKTRMGRTKNMAYQLLRAAGIRDVDRRGCGIEEIEKIQKYLKPEYRICVYSKDHLYAKIFDGGNADGKLIHLLLYDGHYAAITSMAAFYEVNNFCEYCQTGYRYKKYHRCPGVCRCCQRTPACQRTSADSLRFCRDCCRYFENPQCYINHKSDRLAVGRKIIKMIPVCDREKVCKYCGKKRLEGHVCGERKCKTCRENVLIDADHWCHVQPIVKDTKSNIFIVYDFETRQQDADGEKYRHVVNCAASLRWCGRCPRVNEYCENCDVVEEETKWKVFVGNEALDDFCHYLFDTEWNCPVTAIAHNAKSFDCQFILEYLHRQTVKPSIIIKGLQIIQMKYGRVTLIDSLNFMPMALAAIPKAFGLQETKGYFPHLFNKVENWNYEGALPDRKYYGKQKFPEKFEAWYDEEIRDMARNGRLFNFKKALEDYCKQDVLVLAEGCHAFLKEFSKITDGANPFKSCTFAAACSRYYRTDHMVSNSIGVIPYEGYRRRDKHSLGALKYLKWLAHSEKMADKGVYIRHAGNGGECKIGPYKADGCLRATRNDRDLKTIYEYHGCYYHGCLRCFGNQMGKKLATGLTAGEAYYRTCQRIDYFQKAGYAVHEIWECRVKEMLNNDPEMKQFYDNLTLRKPLEHRDALYGGRTNAVRLYYKARGAEKIKYVDVCSLYPWVCKNGEFPIGHPIVLTENFLTVTAENRPYHGLVYCRVNPPRRLYHPVLPWRVGSKLCFPLCATCAREMARGGFCTHSAEQRALEGVWVTLELYAALERGYEIQEIYEVWHYEQWRIYDGRDSSTGLFTTYMNLWLKEKVQASGYPPWTRTEADRDAYLEDYYRAEGIVLDKDKMEKNPAKRQIAKMALNSLWGKLAQKENPDQLEYFTSLEVDKYLKVATDPAYEVNSLMIFNENLVALNYRMVDQIVAPSNKTNCIVAAYVTAQARLKLYYYLERLGRRVLYFDTDSIVYVQPDESAWEPPLGDHLGDMTDELRDYGEGSYVYEFVAGGPKQYGLKIWSTSDQKTVTSVKLRGFTMDNENCKKLNFENLKRCVDAFVKENRIETIWVRNDQIVKTKDRRVFTEKRQKNYKVVYDKRVLGRNYDTLPYGY